MKPLVTSQPLSLELYGTHGSLFIGGADNQIRLVSSKMESQVPVG